MNPDDKVRMAANPRRIGLLSNEVSGPARRHSVLVHWLDNNQEDSGFF